ncbi:MAG: hypothetical protein WCT31_05555, partial [Candidatus Micrarchaeia archaeon]
MAPTGALANRFALQPDYPRPPISSRRFQSEPLTGMDWDGFESFYVRTISRAGLRFPLSEQSMVRLAAVANESLRCERKISVPKASGAALYDSAQVPVRSAFLSRLWADDLQFSSGMHPPHTLVRDYINRGGAGVFTDGGIQETRALGFLSDPEFARAHLGIFRVFLNSIPSANIEFGLDTFHGFCDYSLTQPMGSINHYVSELLA